MVIWGTGHWDRAFMWLLWGGCVSLLTPVSRAVVLPLVKGFPPLMLILRRGRSVLPAFLGREVMPRAIRVWWRRRGPRVGNLRGKPAPVRRLSRWHGHGGPSSRLRPPPPPCVHPPARATQAVARGAALLADCPLCHGGSPAPVQREPPARTAQAGAALPDGGEG